MPVAPRPRRGAFAADSVPFCVAGVTCSRTRCCPQPCPCPCTPVLGFLGEEGDSQSGPKSLVELIGQFPTVAGFSTKSHAALPATQPGRGERKNNKHPKAALSSDGLQQELRSSLAPLGKRHPARCKRWPCRTGLCPGHRPQPPAGQRCFLLNCLGQIISACPTGWVPACAGCAPTLISAPMSRCTAGSRRPARCHRVQHRSGAVLGNEPAATGSWWGVLGHATRLPERCLWGAALPRIAPGVWHLFRLGG